MNKKVVIIGLDGASFDLILPWVERGELPNFKRILKDSTYSSLKTIIPPMTLPAWNSFATGCNPGKHGTFDFTERIPGTLDLKVVNSNSRKVKTIWDILSDVNKKVCVAAVPGNYPPEHINGIMISGFDSPAASPDSMYPPQIYKQIERDVGAYEASADFIGTLWKGDIKTAVSAIVDVIDKKSKVMKYLFQMDDWDCFMFLFGETDSVVHYFWKYHDPMSPHYKSLTIEDPVLTIYKKIDHVIGEFVPLLDDNTALFFVSDHGVGGAGDKVIFLNRWLESEGLLRFSYSNTALLRLLEYIKFSIKARASVKHLKGLRFGENKIGYQLESYLRFKSVNWPNTKAFSEETPYYPNIWINLKGREPMGIVNDGSEYELLRGEIISRLKAWKDPETGYPVVREAYPREALYSGKYTQNAPDIIIDWNYDNGYSYLNRNSILSKKGVSIKRLDKSSVENSQFMMNRSGSHRENGIFIARGNNIKVGENIDSVHITDYAPTILSLLDVPIPDDMDGKVLTDIFVDKGIIKRDTVKESKTGKLDKKNREERILTSKEEEKIKKRLQDLGYLE